MTSPAIWSTVRPLMKSRATVAGIWLRISLDALTGVGFDAWGYWKKRKLAPPTHEMGAYFPWQEVVSLWRTAVRATGDPHLGLRAAEGLPVQTPNMFSFLLLSAGSVYEAFVLAERFQGLVANTRSAELEDTGTHVVWRIHVPLDPPAMPQQLEYTLGIFLRICAFAGGPGFRPVSACFRHAAQGDVAEYQRFFGCPVTFLQPENALRFDHEAMHRPAQFSNPSALKMLVEAAETALRQREGESWTGRVAAAVQPILGDVGCTLDGVAKRLAVSTRTLQRHLAGEHTAFQDVLDMARRQRALELVLQPNLTMMHIAEQTGFADPRTLNRAFQRWTGRGPASYREAKLTQRRRLRSTR
jgi:AraC-like DNA-binding protein